MMPSRFTSTFGWLTLEEAEKFRNGPFCSGDEKIFRVTAGNYFKADMTHLKGTSIAGLIINARKYWSGEASLEPQWELLIPLPNDVEIMD